MNKAADSPDIELRDGDGKPLGTERFERHYRLIYDIPDDPLARLPELLREIRSTQLRIESSARALRERCLRVRAGIDDARNPAKIAEREKEIQTVQARREARRDESRRPRGHSQAGQDVYRPEVL